MQVLELLAASSSDKQGTGVHQYGLFYNLIFDAVFARKDAKLNVLEIGVSKFSDGSLNVWQSLDTVDKVVGIDVVQYKGMLGANTTFYMIDAYQQTTLDMLKNEHEPFDIIIDDGSHHTKDQSYFLNEYQTLLSDVGLLICEDVKDVAFYKQMCEAGFYGIDLRGNRPEGENPVDDDRILLWTNKASSEVDTLPIDFPHTYQFRDNRIAVSIPIYEIAQVKGAALSAIGIINNTDLGEKGVPVYFHIDNMIVEAVVAQLESYKVPNHMMRKVSTNKLDTDIEHTHHGMKLMGLIDKGKAHDVWLIVNPNTIACTTGHRLKWYDTLVSLENPACLDVGKYIYKTEGVDYSDWVKGICLAAGLKYDDNKPLPEQEKDVIKHIGFNINSDVPRTKIYTELFAVPTQHAIIPFLSSIYPQCYQDEYLLGLWQMANNQLVSLKDVLGIPCYESKDNFEKRDELKDSDGYLVNI